MCAPTGRGPQDMTLQDIQRSYTDRIATELHTHGITLFLQLTNRIYFIFEFFKEYNYDKVA